MQWKQPTRIQAETIPHALHSNMHRPSSRIWWLVIAASEP
jgi:hypothetical protein